MAKSMSMEEQSQEFYFYLGTAITQWARLEERLFNFCWVILQTHPVHTAIIYYRTPSLEARLTLTDNLIQTILPPRTKKDGGHDHPTTKLWKKLLGEVKDELPFRNQLAHWPVDPHFEPKMDEAGVFIVDFTFASYASVGERLRGGKYAAAKKLKIEDVKNHIGRIGDVLARLKSFYDNEFAALPREQPPPVVPSRIRSVQIKKGRSRARKHQPRSSRR